MDAALALAFEEDRRGGDITSENAVPAEARAIARLVAKEAGVLAGIELFARAFVLCDQGAVVRLAARDGDDFEVGAELAFIEGRGRALLLAERTALNFLQRLSGIATATARYVALADGARVLDTRKTTPGLRVFEKYAVRCGGGENHRFGLFDEVMLKDNHIELAGKPIEDVLRDVRRAVGSAVRITAEARDAAEARAAVRGGADVVMLDNMSPAAMSELLPALRSLAERTGHTVEFEASGGITADTLPAVAASGVDRISTGALTHSVRALDLSLALEPLT